MIINNSVSTKPPTLPTSPTTTSTTSKPTQTWWPTPSPTQPPTRPPTRPPTQPPTRPPTQPPTRPPTQPPTRPPTQSPTQPPSETNCVNGQYYPVPDDCSSFARCVDGVLKKNKCSPGLHWNVAETLCDWPTNANCEADGHGNAPTLIYPVTFWCIHWNVFPVTLATVSTPTRSTTPFVPTAGTTPKPPSSPRPPSSTRPTTTVTTRPPVSPVVAGPCREGEYSQSGPDCSVYQWCVNGQFIEQGCQAGLHWNQKIKVCDWPANANCPFTGGKIRLSRVVNMVNLNYNFRDSSGHDTATSTANNY